ncbi:MAG: flagellar export chaperone FliS [Lachnospiraceae bacterium]|nr:flagellar export chaperone FliS [Lachnospiraceae bacterium]
MALPNAYAQYNNSRILTASPAELTLLLYEGAIKFGNIAILKMEQKDIQGAHNNIVRVEKIIDYLRETLDMKYPVAQDFENIYVYLSRRITDAMVSKNPADMEEVVMHLRSVRDNWKEVMKKANVS